MRLFTLSAGLLWMVIGAILVGSAASLDGIAGTIVCAVVGVASLLIGSWMISSSMVYRRDLLDKPDDDDVASGHGI